MRRCLNRQKCITCAQAVALQHRFSREKGAEFIARYRYGYREVEVAAHCRVGTPCPRGRHGDARQWHARPRDDTDHVERATEQCESKSVAPSTVEEYAAARAPHTVEDAPLFHPAEWSRERAAKEQGQLSALIILLIHHTDRRGRAPAWRRARHAGKSRAASGSAFAGCVRPRPAPPCRTCAATPRKPARTRYRSVPP
jgi:hypothetical protein